ncbi:carbonic anhydrase family protein [Lysinibacillus endophyticus]|uniref:carbonic anhydrase n=1 Tax=Ureibacillus endophyticus TaxID=1978490 RepID=UPI00313535AE
MKKNYVIAYVTFAIVLALVAYYTMDTTEQAPVESEEQLTVNWSYDGETGPQQWMNVSADYAACGRGELQSPINIEVSNTAKEELDEEVKLNYEKALFEIENNGHTIEANSTTPDNSLMINDEEYKLTGIHFHSPSEHQINGQYFDMEAHLFHETKDGKMAIIGLFIESGEENKELAEMWANMPKDGAEAVKVLKNPINLEQLLPEEKNVYQYVGSLTSPPCTEGVNWFVLEQPIEMSNEQINQFSSIFLQNNRPIQQLNNRDVYKIELD